VAIRNVEFATFAFFNHLAVAPAFGVLPGAPPEQNSATLRALFADTPDGATRRVRLREFFGILRMEFAAADIELGFEYAGSPAVVPDGSPAPPRDPAGNDYRPAARPGHRLPHAWFDRLDERVSTHDLLRPGRFLLLAGHRGHAWADAAGTVSAQTGVPIDAVLAGPGAELQGGDGSWYALRGHDDAGAVLVRPDGHVGYRAATAAPDTTAALGGAVRTILGRST
jgi:2,4-dichlorophenol 6-monooxygenase